MIILTDMCVGMYECVCDMCMCLWMCWVSTVSTECEKKTIFFS